MLRDKFTTLQGMIKAGTSRFQAYSSNLRRTAVSLPQEAVANGTRPPALVFTMVPSSSAQMLQQTRSAGLKGGLVCVPLKAYECWDPAYHVYVTKADVRLPGLQGLSKKLNATVATIHIQHRGNAAVKDEGGNVQSFQHDPRSVTLEWDYVSDSYSMAGDLAQPGEMPTSARTMLLSPFGTWVIDLSNPANDGLDFSHVDQALITWSGFLRLAN